MLPKYIMKSQIQTKVNSLSKNQSITQNIDSNKGWTRQCMKFKIKNTSMSITLYVGYFKTKQ